MSEKTPKRARKHNITKEQLIEAFQTHKTVRQVAQSFDCSIGTIDNLRRLYQVEPNRKVSTDSPTRTCKVCQLTKDSKRDYYQLNGKPKERTCKSCVCKQYMKKAKTEVMRAAMARYRDTENGKRTEAVGYFRRQFAATFGLSAHEQPELYNLWLEVRNCQYDYKYHKESMAAHSRVAEPAKQWAKDTFHFFKTARYATQQAAKTPTQPQDGKN
jgi:transposase-like protein